MDVVFARWGKGAPLVLLHGLGGRRQVWDPIFDLLAAERDVIALDMPGFGESRPLPRNAGYGVDTAIQVIRSFFDRIEVVRPHVAGNSLGGLFALELACRGLVRSATALSPAGFFTKPQALYAFGAVWALRLGAGIPESVMRRLARHPRGRALLFGMLYGRPGLVDVDAVVGDARALRRAEGFGPMLRAKTGYGFCGSAAEVPVTVAWGTRDRVLWPSQADRARQRLPEARFVWLEGCGHMPMNDDPKLVAKTILECSAG